MRQLDLDHYLKIIGGWNTPETGMLVSLVKELKLKYDAALEKLAYLEDEVRRLDDLLHPKAHV